MRIFFSGFLLLYFLFTVFSQAQATEKGQTTKNASQSIVAKLLPKDNKLLLIIGQDLDSVADYVGSGLLPEPGGITTYLAFYSLNRDSFPVYGWSARNECSW